MENPLNILCAEDDADDQFLFREAIQVIYVDKEYKLEFVENGYELLFHLAQVPKPNIIFLDLNMPKKDGISCLKEIRADQKFKNMPIAILSTSESNEDILAAFEHGANFYAIKPMSFIELSRILEACLKKSFEQTFENSLVKQRQLDKSFIIK